jgi:hypothetical protein
MKTLADLKVGDTVWVFDVNRRIYPAKGGATSAPIWREHWQEVRLVSETRKSFTLSHGVWIGGKSVTKLKKSDDPTLRHKVCLSLEELEGQMFVHDHCYKVAEMVRKIEDPAILRQIIRLVGYDPAVRSEGSEGR